MSFPLPTEGASGPEPHPIFIGVSVGASALSPRTRVAEALGELTSNPTGQVHRQAAARRLMTAGNETYLRARGEDLHHGSCGPGYHGIAPRSEPRRVAERGSRRSWRTAHSPCGHSAVVGAFGHDLTPQSAGLAPPVGHRGSSGICEVCAGALVRGLGWVKLGLPLVCSFPGHLFMMHVIPTVD